MPTQPDPHPTPIAQLAAPEGRPPSAAIATGLLSAIAFVVLAALVANGPLPIDESIRSNVGAGGPIPPVLDALNLVGSAIAWDIGVAILAAALFLIGRRPEAGWLGGGVLLGEALSTGAKLIVDRQRPPGNFVQDLVTQASYPSGHATRTAVTGALLVLLLVRGRWSRIASSVAAIGLAVLMGLARVVAGEHWPTDVLGAYLLAAVVIALVVAVPVRFRQSGPTRPAPALAPRATTSAGRRP